MLNAKKCNKQQLNLFEIVLELLILDGLSYSGFNWLKVTTKAVDVLIS